MAEGNKKPTEGFKKRRNELTNFKRMTAAGVCNTDEGDGYKGGRQETSQEALQSSRTRNGRARERSSLGD